VTIVRAQLRIEATTRGDFVCHHTAYEGEGMELKTRSQHRQCPGATAWYKTHLPFGE
jgi:hypothetical protein